MEQLRKFYETVLQNKTLKSEVKQAKEAFTPKPFVAEFRRLKLLLQASHPVFSAFSVITGTAFLYYLFASQLPLILAVILSVAMLLILELAKAFFARLMVKKLFLRSAQSPVFSAIALPLFALSIFLSVNGTEMIYSNLDESKQELSGTFQAKKDSVNTYYDSLANIENSDFAAFKASVTYKGKINVYNPATKSRIQANTARLERYQTDKGKALSVLEKEYEKQEKARTAETGFARTTWIVISGINEALILACLFGLVWYQYRVSQENEALTEAETYTLSTDAVQALIQSLFVHGNTVPVLPTATPQSPYNPNTSPGIGFQFGAQNSRNDAVQQDNSTRNNGTRKVGDGNRVCEHCGDVFVYKVWNHKFCSESCRVAAWELKTGRKLRKGKGK